MNITNRNEKEDDKKYQAELLKLHKRVTRLRALDPGDKTLKKIERKVSFLTLPKKMRQRLRALGLDPDSRNSNTIIHR